MQNGTIVSRYSTKIKFYVDFEQLLFSNAVYVRMKELGDCEIFPEDVLVRRFRNDYSKKVSIF